VRLEAGPAWKPVLTRQQVLRVCELQRGIALLHFGQQGLRLLFQVFEIGLGRKLPRHNSSLIARVR
jgi:hypothetical protein